MKKTTLPILALITITLIAFNPFQKTETKTKITDPKIIHHIIDPSKNTIRFFWKNKEGALFNNFQNLKPYLEKENKELVFAMNGGMFKKGFSPQGLYIENGKILAEIDTIRNGYGNFYLHPNGIFYLTKNNLPVICKTDAFNLSENIKYATQSGPMLLTGGVMHPEFNDGSKNVHIRNGVGILPNGHLLFAMSKEKINFYDFASFFKKQGCKDALYLDGFVSRLYLPDKNWKQLDGALGVMIGDVKK